MSELDELQARNLERLADEVADLSREMYALQRKNEALQMAQPDMFGAPDVGGERDPHDRFFTPPWATHALLDYLGRQLRGDVWEPAAGNGAILDLLADHPDVAAYGSDILPGREDIDQWDFLQGLSEPTPECFSTWQPNWIVTNPPYNAPTGTATDFVKRALNTAIDGVAMLLRLSWMEPCEDRADIWRADRPTHVVVLPRVHYLGAPGSNNQTSAWFIWHRVRGAGRSTKLTVYDAAKCWAWGRR